VQVVLSERITAVYARNFIAHPTRKKRIGEETAEYSVTTEDGGMVFFETESGIQGSVLVSQVSAGYKNQLQISVDCEKYSMQWNQEQSDRLTIGSREYGVTQIFAAPDAVDKSISRYATLPSGHPVGWADAFTNGIREFYDSLLQGSYKVLPHSYSDFANGTYIMKIVEVCLKSNITQKWERV
jgi:predicted dehydrogenase